ncbi:MAG TPA: amidohydrolase family protein [Rhizomicrobium sp.]
MRTKAISADSHIDMCWLPAKLFLDNASSALRDRMPYVVDSPEGPKWTSNLGVNLGFVGGVGTTGWKFVSGRSQRVDAMAAEGLYSDAQNGILRVSDPDLRVQAQIRDGLDGEVIYGVLGLTTRLRDAEASLEVIRIYNDWLEQFCSRHPERLLGLASIPSHEPDVAVAEIKRLKSFRYIRGLDVSAAAQRVPLYHPDWAPFWEAVSEINLPVSFHAFGLDMVDVTGFDEVSKKRAHAAALVSAQMGRASRLVIDIIMGGVLERFPTVKVVFAEAGVGWLAHVLDRMDMLWEEEFQKGLGLPRPPSEYWRRQCATCFQNEKHAAKLIDIVGSDNIMWASDFPHPDGLWPDSQKFIKDQFWDLSPDLREKITYGNAARLYGLTN